MTAALAAARLERALGDASAIVDGWIAGRYPGYPARAAGDAPTAVSAAVVDIALGRVFGGDEARVAAAEKAVAWCRSVASGLVSLDADGDGEPEAADGAGDILVVDAPERVFDSRRLSGFTGR